MATRVKGIFKNIRYISQIFEDHDQEHEKNEEIQIGNPTDVKHVAHVGWDGPSTTAAADSRSWMKDKNTGDSNPEVKWVSEDSKRSRAKKTQDKEADGNKTMRRRSTDKSSGEAARPRQSRRSQVDGGADVPKKTRRKKSESHDGVSRPSRDRTTRSLGGGDAAAESESDVHKSIGSIASEDEEERECRVISNE